MDVLILAGGKTSKALRELTGVTERAFLPMRGRPTVEIVLEAVAPHGEPILVGGPAGLSGRQVDAGASFVESLSRGVEVVQTETFLLATADLPHLTRQGVEDYLRRCDPTVMLNYPILDAEASARAYPGMHRTTLRLRDGEFTGGNIALVHTALMRQALPLIERAYALRKNPIGLGSMIGWDLVARLVVGRVVPATISIAYLERRVGRFLRAPVRAVRTPYVEIGADIDDIAQYMAVTAL